jgi:hypothetical protein
MGYKPMKMTVRREGIKSVRNKIIKAIIETKYTPVS